MEFFFCTNRIRNTLKYLNNALNYCINILMEQKVTTNKIRRDPNKLN